MSTPLNVALIGQKFMGRAHSNAWSQVNKFFELPRRTALHTIAARNAEELGPFAAKWGWGKWTTDWRSLARDPEVHLVDVGTSNDAHAEQSIAMLEAKKHVACEKPLAGTLDDARAMRDAAKRAKTKTFVWFNYRRCPAVALARQLIEEGKLGRIYHVRATYLQSWGGPDTPMSWRFQKRVAGSGAHGDLNAHIVDLARFLTGDEVVEIHGAVARTFVTERTVQSANGKGGIGAGNGRNGGAKKAKSDVDDAVLFLASFKSGTLASFEATRVATGRLNANAIELNGEKGALRFEFEAMNELWFHDATQAPRTAGWRRIVATSSAGEHPYAANWWPDAHVLGYEHGFVNMAADVVRVLSGEKPVVALPDFADAYETQRVLEAALISAREKSAVKLAEVR
ncbi:MAG: Gfo/Idh/MocA family oxidoreductase [Planctomycetota bacterium]